jgi:hypothetical protein
MLLPAALGVSFQSELSCGGQSGTKHHAVHDAPLFARSHEPLALDAQRLQEPEDDAQL